MAKRITEFTSATVLAETDVLPVVDLSDTTQATSGTTKKLALSLIADYLKARVETLTNKTLTSPVLNTGVSGTAVLDEDNMVSNSATQLATQQSIKAYVDAGKAGASYTSFITSNTTTTSTSGVQVGSAQVTVTTKGGMICIIGSAVLSNSANTARLGFDIDGSMLSDNALTNSGTPVRVDLYRIQALTAGSHTIKLMYYTQSGGTTTLHAYNSFNLGVWEL
jgi:hypothetical protein